MFTIQPSSKCPLAFTARLLLENKGTAQAGQIMLYTFLDNSITIHKTTIISSKFSNELENAVVYSFLGVFLIFHDKQNL